MTSPEKKYCRGSLSGSETETPEEQQGPTAPMNFEMEEVDALDPLIPKYITSMDLRRPSLRLPPVRTAREW